MRDIENKRTPLSCFFFFIFYNTLLSLSFSLSHFNNFSRTRKERKRAADPLLVSLPRKIPEGEKGAQTAGRDTSSLSRALFPTLSTLFVFSLSLALSVTRISWPRPLSPPPPSARKESDNIKGKGRNGGIQGGEESSLSSQSLFFWQKKKRACFFVFFVLFLLEEFRAGEENDARKFKRVFPKFDGGG